MRIFGGHPRERDLALFAGGELGPLSRWRIERHLESCAACKAEAAAYFHLSAELSELAELPDIDWNALARNIRAAAARDAPGRLPPRFGWDWKTAAAPAAAACLALAVWAVRENPPPAPASPAGSPPAVSAAADGFAEERGAPYSAALDEWSSPDAQITAEGRLSMRSFDARSGTMTITEYYAP